MLFCIVQCNQFSKIKIRWIFRHQKELLEILNTILLMLTSGGLLMRGILIKHNLLFYQRKLCLPKMWSPTSIKRFHTSDTLLKTAVHKENKWNLICHKINCTIYFSWESHAFVKLVNCNSFALKRSIPFMPSPNPSVFKRTDKTLAQMFYPNDVPSKDKQVLRCLLWRKIIWKCHILSAI